MTQYHINSHTIGGLPEKPYSSLTGLGLTEVTTNTTDNTDHC